VEGKGKRERTSKGTATKESPDSREVQRFLILQLKKLRTKYSVF